jgi:hypothetical protein
MTLLKKGLGLSIIGITIFILSVSFWNENRKDALDIGQDWTDSVHLQFDENNQVVIDRDNFNFQVQGQGVIQSIYQPIQTTFYTVERVYNVISRFFGLDNLPNQDLIQEENDELYDELYDVYLYFDDSYTYENFTTYYQDFSQEERILYFEWSHSYELRTYVVIFGVRLWSSSTVQLTYDQLDDLNDIYNWV